MKRKMTANKRLKIRAVALDLDGVVYEGDHVIEGAADTIGTLRDKGIEIFFVTNNSGRKRTSIAEKLNQMGINAPLDQIITSGYAAAVLAASLCLTKNDRICLVGSEELAEELFLFNRNIVYEPPAEILVVGLDKAFNYDRLSAGLNALRQGAIFIACNRDRTFPVGNDQVLPGCGPIVAALEWAGGKKADYVVGKPNTLMLELIASERRLPPRDILVVGDSIDSDIVMAENYGCPSVLVTNNSEITNTGILPDFKINSLKHLPHIFSED